MPPSKNRDKVIHLHLDLHLNHPTPKGLIDAIRRELANVKDRNEIHRRIKNVLLLYFPEGDEERIEDLSAKITEHVEKAEEKRGIEISLMGPNTDPVEAALEGKRIVKKSYSSLFIPQRFVKPITTAAGVVAALAVAVPLAILSYVELSQYRMLRQALSRQPTVTMPASPAMYNTESWLVKGLAKLAEREGERLVATLATISYFVGEEHVEAFLEGYGMARSSLHPYVVLAMIAAESGGRAEMGSPEAVKKAIESKIRNVYISPAGAVGLAQIMPSTLEKLYPLFPEEIRIRFASGTNSLHDPRNAILAAYIYLDQFYSQHPSLKELAIIYNCGYGCLSREVLPEETRYHIEKVEMAYSTIESYEQVLRKMIRMGEMPSIIRVIKEQVPVPTYYADSSIARDGG